MTIIDLGKSVHYGAKLARVIPNVKERTEVTDALSNLCDAIRWYNNDFRDASEENLMIAANRFRIVLNDKPEYVRRYVMNMFSFCVMDIY